MADEIISAKRHLTPDDFKKWSDGTMTLFLGICAFCSFFQFDAGLFILPIVWCYSFFHVHNLNGLPDEEFAAVEDDYLIHLPEDTELYLDRKKQLILAWIFIIIGACALWKVILNIFFQFLPSFIADMLYSLSYLLPQVILSILLIILGIHLIRGKKAQLDSEESENEQFARKAFEKDCLDDFFPDNPPENDDKGGFCI